MSGDVREAVPAGQANSSTEAQLYNDIWVKSYSYLRTAMVALLVGLGAAVFYQTSHQGFRPLPSVSAYYYTPAQAIFVGALIGLGACMIALKGTTSVEEVLLNLGGIFAAVVAIVPTSRIQDYRAAVAICEQADSPLLTDTDCPTVQALAVATRANVENNIFALLVMGLLGLVATVCLAVVFKRRGRGRFGAEFWWGFGLALLVWVVGTVAFIVRIEWLIDYAHFTTAVGLLVCVLVVAVANARRHDERPLRLVVDTPTRNRYHWIAVLLVLVAVSGVALWRLEVISIFWLEIAVALLFAVFWLVQTIELMPRRLQPASASRPADDLVEPLATD
ncbi:MAG: hypothetical protein ACRDTU_00265 [Micromonosporaceae bacterium]